MIGKIISHYRIIGEIGHGGMGRVYLANDETLHRRVALKVLNEKYRLSSEAKHRFLREARILSSLDHPNICRIYDFIELGDHHFLVLELIEGPSLRSVLNNGLSRERALSICEQLTNVLVVAHGSGVIHRDLKPENIHITNDGQIKVLDFGLARSGHETVSRPAAYPASLGSSWVRFTPDSHSDATLGEQDPRGTQTVGYADFLRPDATGHTPTRFGDILGTPSYMSPEQAIGESASAASDMYSLGIIMQEMFTGRRAYAESASPGQLYERVSRAETLPVSGVSQDLSELITRLKSPEPRSRPTALETAARLRWVREKPRRRLRRLAIAAAVLVVLFAAAKYTVDLRSERAVAVDARQEADQRRQQAEGLIEFMLGDLRQKLTPVGHLDILDDVGQKVLEYFASVPKTQLTNDELFRRAKALTQIGEVRIAQGSLPAAEQAFREADALASSLAARDPANGEWQLGFGTSQFWIGFVLWRQEDLEGARKHFEVYRDVTEKLVAKDPGQSDWQRELGYAYSNLGSVLEAQGRLKEALEQFERCLNIEVRLCAGSPENQDLRFDLATTHNAVGKVLEAQGRLNEALANFRRDLEIKKALVGESPRNASWREYLARTHSMTASLLEAQGRESEALEHFRYALDILSSLVAQDPSNSTWQRELAINQARKGALLGSAGQRDEALHELNSSVKTFEKLVGLSPTDAHWAEDLARMRVLLAAELAESGDTTAALAQVSPAVHALKTPRSGARRRTSGVAVSASAQVLLGEILWQRGERVKARTAWQQALDELEPVAADSMNYRLLDPWARALVRLNRRSAARPVLDRLRVVGYSKPAFWAFCSSRGFAKPRIGRAVSEVLVE